MPKSVLIDIAGQTFGKLYVVERAETYVGPNGTKFTMWRCRCTCGRIVDVRSSMLRRKDGKNTMACISCANTKHGHSMPGNTSLTYKSWHSMIIRVSNPKYGYIKKGIKVCCSWRKFINFLADMGERPSREYTIDRFPDKTGDYEPGNCRWATMKEQNRNRSDNVWITIRDRTMVLKDWLTEAGITNTVYQTKRRRGCSHEESLFGPPLPHPRRTEEQKKNYSATRRSFSPEQEIAIIDMSKIGKSYKEISVSTGFSKSVIGRIVLRYKKSIL